MFDLEEFTQDFNAGMTFMQLGLKYGKNQSELENLVQVHNLTR